MKRHSKYALFRINLRRVELVALLVFAGIAVYLWTAPIRAERNLTTASLNELMARSKRDKDSPRVFHYLGMRFQALGLAAPARSALARAVSLDPEDEDAWLGWAAAASATGNDQESFTALNDLTKTHPKSFRGHYTFALFCQAKGLMSKAYEEALAAAKLDPANFSAWRLAGVTAMQLRFYPESEKAFRQALVRNPKDWRNHMGMGDVLTALHRQDEALASFRNAVSLAPNEFAPALALGSAMVRSGAAPMEMSAAEKLLATAVSLNPASASARAALGRCLALQGRSQEARRPLEQAVLLAPNASGVHFDLERVYQNLGLTSLAQHESLLHHSLKSYEELVLSLGGQIHAANSSEARLKLARLYAQHGDYFESAQEYRSLIVRAPQMVTAKTELAQIIKRQRGQQARAPLQPFVASTAMAADGPHTETHDIGSPGATIAANSLLKDADSIFKANLYPEAETAYRQLITESTPRSITARAYQGLGLALNALGKNEDAFTALNRAIEMDATLTEARFTLARLYFEVGFEDQAARHLEIAVRQAPANAQYLHALGTCYINDPPRYLRSEDVLKKANELTPGKPLYLRDLALAEEKINQFDAAESHLRQGLRFDPHDPATLDSLGAFLINHRPTTERQQEATTLFKASLTQAKNHPAPLTGLGRIALDGGNVKQAVEFFEKAVVLAPGEASLWYKLGTAYDRLGNRERAKACRDAFRDIDGYNADLSHTEELARTNLKDPGLRLRLARLYARGAQNARAINQYQMSLNLDPANAAAKRELSTLIAKLKSEGHMPQMTTFNGMLIASVPVGAGRTKQ